MIERAILDILILINLASCAFNYFQIRRNRKTRKELIEVAQRNSMYARKNLALARKLHKVEMEMIGLKSEASKS